MTLYEQIGIGYAQTRRDDPRVAAEIQSALEGTTRVVNVGAGTGSYEPRDRFVVAVEPALCMIRQRRESAGPALRATAEALPLSDGSFDAALAILTIHHWADVPTAIAELKRVADRVVVFTFDPLFSGDFWLTDDYFPQFTANDRERCTTIDALCALLGEAEVKAVPIPRDCEDGFLGAYWGRPRAYLDPAVQAGISCFSAVDPGSTQAGLARLAADLDSGRWERDHGSRLANLDTLDLGYRLVVSARRCP